MSGVTALSVAPDILYSRIRHFGPESSGVGEKCRGDRVKDAWPFVVAFLVVAFVINFWKVLLGIAVAIAVVAFLVWAIPTLAVPWWRRRRAAAQDRRNGEVARRSGLAARATTQHERYLAGDPRGIYGEYPPADLG